MILPYFSLLQFGQRFLSFPLFSSLINSAAPVSLYSCNRMERGMLKLLKCVSLIRFTLSCAEHSVGSWVLGLHIWALFHRLGVRGPGWGHLWEPRGPTCRLHLVDIAGGTARLCLWELLSFLWSAGCHWLWEAGTTRLFSHFTWILQEWCSWQWSKPGLKKFDSSRFCLFVSFGYL